MNKWKRLGLALLLIGATCACTSTSSSFSKQSAGIQNAGGLQLLPVADSIQPKLRIVLPGRDPSDKTIEVLFPEHVTAIKSGSDVAEHLYLPSSRSGEPPRWHRAGNALEYERDLPGDIHMVARATLEDDGVRFHYEFTNHSNVAYKMIYAVTDPRLTAMFHDVRLERTYVHHADGFDLLASETPERLTMPLDQWLPARYLVSFRWPVPSQRVEHRDDGVTYYNKSRPVDQPFIATLSTDRTWLVASFTNETGNVWSNPELTCQHVDPQTSLAPGEQATLEVKILILHGSLEDAFQRAIHQRSSLR